MNRLSQEKSPYLLQHAANPVDWYPWGDEAFQKAKEEDKPVFLSIGYSTCHWCHVMEEESFEDERVADLMNEAFVCVKVDREERPDIDNIYMTVCQMMTGSGGWPLTVLLTPDKKPFFATTYIPRESRFGRAGMLELVPRLKELWQTRKKDVLDSADEITAAIQEAPPERSQEEVDASVLKLAFVQLSQRYDEAYGGFGSSPKFPTPHQLSFILRYWKRTGDESSLRMVERTLTSMRMGGIYDHLGFGFHRYSTDRNWLVPHFEKMLYDQAMLGIAYTETYQATRKEEFAITAHEIFTYVLRDMTSPEGGFYSAEDADSEGEEGKFYYWTELEIRELLGDHDAELVMKIFNVDSYGNFIDQMTGGQTGENILHLTQPLAETASELKIPEAQLRESLEKARARLFEHREKRIHPYKDDKILTDWNGLMIAALSKAAQVWDKPEYLKAAKDAVEFIVKNLRSESGGLLHRFRDGQAGLTSHIDDYAFVIWGLLELYEASFDVSYLQLALELNDYLIAHFWDDRNGGFYFTPDNGESLLTRNKEVYDGAIPSGNSVAMLNLLRLARITGTTDFEDRASKLARAFSRSVQAVPSAHTQFMIGVDFSVGPSYEIVIAGKSQAPDTKALLHQVRNSFLPNKVLLLRPTDEQNPPITKIARFTDAQGSVNGKATAYVCQNFVCEAPVTDSAALSRLIR